MPPDLIVSWCATMRGKIKMCLGVSFFHLTKNVVLDPWVINCAGVSTGCHHFPWLNPAACSALQLAHHSQLHKSVLCYTPTAPTCRSVSNVIVIAPSDAVQKPLGCNWPMSKKGNMEPDWHRDYSSMLIYVCVHTCIYIYCTYTPMWLRIHCL